jgi:hypothetical protein
VSSTYKRICLSHDPPLVLDEEVPNMVPPEQPAGHPNCAIALGRYSYPLIEIWLPISYYDKDGNHEGKWYDVSWVGRVPAVLELLQRGG